MATALLRVEHASIHLGYTPNFFPVMCMDYFRPGRTPGRGRQGAIRAIARSDRSRIALIRDRVTHMDTISAA